MSILAAFFWINQKKTKSTIVLQKHAVLCVFVIVPVFVNKGIK